MMLFAGSVGNESVLVLENFSNRRIFAAAFLAVLLTGAIISIGTAAYAQQNPIQIENSNPGTTAWRLTNPASNHEIVGYASLTSVNSGGQISFFVNTTDASYKLTIFRLGWYGGLGGRQMTTPVDLAGTVQNVPSPDPTYGLLDLAWIDPYLFSVPSNWVSGIYVAQLTGDQSGKQALIIFVVRNDGRPSALIYQQAATTSEAYNPYGGKSLYTYNSTSSIPLAQQAGAKLNSAVKVSFNRPYSDNWGTGVFFSYEFDMVAWLESAGYDVTYSTDVDTHTSPSEITLHKGFINAGHDEYWSYEMRQNVTGARDQGVSLGFFSANGCYWQIRFEASNVTGDSYRTIVGYKEDASQDPDASIPSLYYQVTTQWRLQKGNVAPLYPAQPEDAFMGVMYNGYEPVSGNIVIVDPSSWVFNGTGLKKGSTLNGLLGYEVDREYGDQPSNTILLAHSPYRVKKTIQYGEMTVYQASSGATVFAAGTVHWDYGLSNISPFGPSSSLVNPAAQQITRNVLNQFIGLP
jgi:hypothetical protein